MIKKIEPFIYKSLDNEDFMYASLFMRDTKIRHLNVVYE